MQNIGLVLYYLKENRYSFNALVGALETEESFHNLSLYFAESEDELDIMLDSLIQKYENVIVGVSFATTQLWSTYTTIKKLKEKYINKVIYLAGGPHPTGDPLGTLKMGFDIVVRGEGEETLIALLKTISRNENFRNIKGIAFLDNQSEYHYTGKGPWINLDKYPPFAIKHNKFGPIEITRGCPFICYFCQTPYILGGHPRHRSVEKICEYVQIMKNKNLKDIRFITPNAFSYGSRDGKELNLSKLEELLSSIKNLLGSSGRIFIGSFPSEVRPEHVTKETIDIVLKYANNDNVIIGAQSGSQRILDLCHRGHTVSDVYKAVELTIKSGLTANVDFIFGLPQETKGDVKLTLKVMQDLIKMGAKIHAHTFLPLPQTPFAKAPPGRIVQDIRRMINDFIPGGVVYGDWVKQEKMAREIARYLKTGKLESKI